MFVGSHLVFITETARDRVSRLDLVYIPKPGGHDKLVRITDCIWDGPKWSTKYDLAQFDDYSRNPKVKKLFQKVFSKQAPGLGSISLGALANQA